MEEEVMAVATEMAVTAVVEASGAVAVVAGVGEEEAGVGADSVVGEETKAARQKTTQTQNTQHTGNSS